jgi:preprotein translocase subunit SecG
MQLFITIVHVLLSLSLILIILLQPGKEGAAVLGGGGGGNQMYGPRGQANFLGRATTLVAAMFMVTSITLAYRSSERTQAGTGNLEDVMKELDAEEASAPAPSMVTPPAPALPAPTQVNDAAAPEADGTTPEAPSSAGDNTGDNADDNAPEAGTDNATEGDAPSTAPAGDAAPPAE